MAATKDAIVVCLDVGPGMCQPTESGTDLDLAVKVLNMVVQQRLFSQSKDEIGLVLVGTNDTDNALANDGAGYEHVSTVRSLGQCDWKFLQYLEDKIVPGDDGGDLVDGLVVALDLLARETQGRKCNRRILMITNAGSPCSEDQLDAIVQGFGQLDCQLQIVGPDLDQDDDDGDDQPPVHRGKKTPMQVAGEAVLTRVLQQASGESVSFQNAIEVLSFFKKRQTKQTSTFRGCIEIGSDTKINVWSYLRVKSVKPSSFKRMSAVSQAAAQPGAMKVMMDRSYHLNDEDETEVEKADLAKGYRFGKTIVPMLKIDEQAMKFTTTKSMKVLGFTAAQNVKIQNRLGDSVTVVVPAPGDQHAAIAFSALVHALAETDKMAVVRYVARANSAPKIGVCFAHIRPLYECLIFTAMPFMEDIRQYTFASLTGKQVTTEQSDIMDSLISNMDLCNQVDEDGDTYEVLQSKHMLNPVLQHIFQCVQRRALATDEPLPELDAVLRAYLDQPQQVATDCTAELKRISEIFKLEVVEKKRKHADDGRSAWQQSDLALDADAPAAKRTNTSADGNNVSLGITMEELTADGVTEVGTVEPVKNFRAMLNRRDVDLSTKAFDQMSAMVLKLVRDSISDQFFAKALGCLRELRAACIELSEVDVFNSHIRTVKRDFSVGSNSFWNLVSSNGVTLISSDEASSSNVSPTEAKKFIEADQPESVHATPDDDVDADDFADMLD
ncbi:X-ray repair cross-complementing protein 5-like [Sycon ciliatum]|uniref:X-ray repair cross-complementing protein 5-like n=1 Tax=Sycon ciliatum TaxID=27933 RepID=UPI0031F62FD5